MSKTIRPLILPAVALLLLFALNFSAAAHSPFCMVLTVLQEKKDDGTTEKDETAVTESNLETFYLRRQEDGKMIPFFKVIPFEEFEEIYRLYLESKQPRPNREYSFENIEVAGKVDKSFSELAIKFEIRALAEGWTNVPLRLDGLILEKTTSGLPQEDFFITRPANSVGYELWFKSAADKTYQFTISGFRSIETVAGKSQLQLSLPNAPFSKIDLDVPGVAMQPETSEDALLSEPKSIGDLTRLSARGPKGDFKLSWRNMEQKVMVVEPSVFSTANITARIESQNNVRLQANFDLESFGGKLSSVDIRLPGGVDLIPIEQAGCSIGMLRENELQGSQPSNQRIARVAFDRPTSRPVPFTIVANLKISADQQSPINLSGFDVIGAVRQVGTIDLIAEPKWSLVEAIATLNRVPAIPSENVRQAVFARYEFDRQPFDLQFRIAATPSRVKIRPVHVAELHSDRVELKTRLECGFDGPAPAAVELNIGAWRVSEVGPRSLVESFSIDSNQPNLLTIRLTELARQTFREPQLELDLSQSVDAAAGFVEFDLPQALNASLEPAILAIVPDDNIQLQIEAEKLVGLSPYELPTDLVLASRQQAPLGFRSSPLAEQGRFVAKLSVQSQRITAQQDLEITTSPVRIPGSIPNRLSIRSISSLDVRFEQLARIYLRVPRSAMEESNAVNAPQFILEIDGMRSDYILEPELTALLPVGDQEIISVKSERGKLIGNHELVVQYEVAIAEGADFAIEPLMVWRPVLLTVSAQQIASLADGAASERELVPLEGGVRSITIYQTPGARIVPDAGNWHLDSEEKMGADLRQVFAAKENFAEDQLQFHLETTIAPRQRAQIVDKLLCQTLLGRQTRYERVSFRLETRDDPIEVTLPESAKLIAAFVDGKALNAKDNLRLIIDISNRATAEHVIDLSYQLPETSVNSRYVSCMLPIIHDVSWSKSIYWELVTPADEYFVGAQAGLMPLLKFDWGEGGLFLRTADMEHASLETWVGIPSQPVPDQACNRYVFSSFGPVERYKVFVANRRDLILIAALLVLCLGAIATIFPRVRHPLNWLALIVVLAAFCLRYPDLALIFLQIAAVVTLVGTAIYLIQYAFTRRDHVMRHVHWVDVSHRSTGSRGPSFKSQSQISQS